MRTPLIELRDVSKRFVKPLDMAARMANLLASLDLPEGSYRRDSLQG